MISNTDDMRSLRTEKALRDAFQHLAISKSLHDITIKELTETAGINRKTFYIHYHDIEGFLESIKADFVSTHNEYLGDALERADIEEMFRMTLEYFGKNPVWSYIIMSRPDYREVYHVMEDPRTRPHNFEQYVSFSEDPETLVMYLIGALRNVFCTWYECGMKTSPEVMAQKGVKAVLYGVMPNDK